MTKGNLKRKGLFSFLFQKDRVLYGEEGMRTGRERWRQRQELAEEGRTGSRARLKALKVQPQGQTSSNKVTPPKLHNMHIEATTGVQIHERLKAISHSDDHRHRASAPVSHWSPERWISHWYLYKTGKVTTGTGSQTFFLGSWSAALQFPN